MARTEYPVKQTGRGTPDYSSRIFAQDIDTGIWIPVIANALGALVVDPHIVRTYREEVSRENENWVESMYISKAEFGGNFGVAYQPLNKIYTPITTAGVNTIALVSSIGFDGLTNTMLEIVIDGAGAPGVATFKWRKQTFMGRTWTDFVTGVLTGANILVTDGIRINFNAAGYLVDDAWHVQACGSWHAPENGIESYLTSLFIYPFDAARAAKAGLFRAWCGDYRVVDYATTKGEFPNWRTPIHLQGDGTTKFEVELAEIGAGQIDHIFVVMKDWDE